MNKYFTAIALCSLLTGAAFAGCGADPAFKNRAACEDFITAYNGLECVSDVTNLDPEAVCAGYKDADEADCSAIFDCWTSNMVCEDLGGVSVPANYTLGCPTSCN